MVTACQKTIVSEAGWEIQKGAIGIGIGAGIAAYLLSKQFETTIAYGLVGAIIPYATGWTLNTYGKLCR